MNRRQFLSTAGGAVATLASPAASASGAAAPPNIVFILADDLGYGNLGCYGARQVLTPNLDRMAAEGMKFTQAYAGSTVCAPSRCCLMTGYHTGHARTRGNKYPDLPLRPQDTTVTEILKKAGYRTGLFGKWSLGQLGSTGYPTRKGFDEWFGFFSQSHAHNYYPEHLLDGESAYLCRGNMGAGKKDYAHDLFTDRTLEFLKKKDSRPFFMKVSYTIPHANNELGRDTGDGMEVPSLEPYAGRDWPLVEKKFAAMVTRMDSDVGKLIETLKETGQDRNTLVIFTSDNGPHKEGGHDPDYFDDNGPLRGIKRALYDGGIRVPTLARWPGRIKAGQASDHAWAFWDFLPTACELAGVAAPKGIDGVSIAPTLLGSGKQQQHEYLYWEFHERGFHQAVRMGDWKAIRYGRNKPVELYNVREDIAEASDVAAKNPALVKRAQELFAAARIDDPNWPVNENPKPDPLIRP